MMRTNIGVKYVWSMLSDLTSFKFLCIVDMFIKQCIIKITQNLQRSIIKIFLKLSAIIEYYFLNLIT